MNSLAIHMIHQDFQFNTNSCPICIEITFPDTTGTQQLFSSLAASYSKRSGKPGKLATSDIDRRVVNRDGEVCCAGQTEARF